MGLSDEELAELQEVFALFCGKDKTEMPIDEVGIIMRGMGANPINEELEAIQKEHGNNDVDFATLVTFMEKSFKEKKQATPDEVIESFSCFDESESGKVNVRDIKNILTDLGEPFTAEEMEEFIGAAEPDGDGNIDYKGTSHFLVVIEILF